MSNNRENKWKLCGTLFEVEDQGKLENNIIISQVLVQKDQKITNDYIIVADAKLETVRSWEKIQKTDSWGDQNF